MIFVWGGGKKEEKKKRRDGYVPCPVDPRLDLFPIAKFSCVFSKRGRNSHYFKTEFTCAALCTERNNANIEDLLF